MAVGTMIHIVVLAASGLFPLIRWSPGVTPTQAASILVNDPEFGNRALLKAEGYGDKIIEPLRKASDDFTKLNGRNAPWIATVLSHDKSAMALALCAELFKRNDMYAKLVGAVGLAAQGKYPEELNDSAYIVKVAMKQPIGTKYSSMDPLYNYTSLAVMALAETRDVRAFPYMMKLLERPDLPGFVNTAICGGFGVLDDKDAVPLLRRSLATVGDKGKCEGSVAFVGLISLDDTEAIPLAIERIKNDPTPKGEFVLRALEDVTNQSYGRNYLQWNKWWSKVKATWHVSKDVNLGYSAVYG